MKVKIDYKYKNEGTGSPYWASTTYNKEYMCACAESYAKAKEALIKRVILRLDSDTVTPPPPEEVDVELESAHVNR